MEESLIKHYEELACFDTGIFGTELLTNFLTERGYINLLFKLLSSEKFPSFGYMFKLGATTLWEDWDGRSSHNHPMFGALVKQLYYGLLGLNIDNLKGKILIKLKEIKALEEIGGSVKLKDGEIKVEYKILNRNFFVKIIVIGKIDVELEFEEKVTNLDLGENNYVFKLD